MKRRRGTAAERLRWMHDRLMEAYGPQSWWPAKTPFEVILGAYLTQNTSWKAVERSLENLRAAGALTVKGLRTISLEDLRRCIQPSGFYMRKAPALKAFVTMLDAEFGGSLKKLAAAPTERLRARLLELPGVGQETADAILLYALGHAVPVADEYLRRIVDRHGLVELPSGRRGYEVLAGLTREAFASFPGPQKRGTGGTRMTQGDIVSSTEKKQAEPFNEFHALTVAVGKAHCGRTARCEGCPLEKDREQGTGNRKTGNKGLGER